MGEGERGGAETHLGLLYAFWLAGVGRRRLRLRFLLRRYSLWFLFGRRFVVRGRLVPLEQQGRSSRNRR